MPLPRHPGHPAAGRSGRSGVTDACAPFPSTGPSPACRGAVRAEAQLLITNPDMLHMSMLPVHGDFGRVLRSLRYVVVDEGHAYRGQSLGRARV